MYLVFLDEFGHIGPFIGRKHPSFNQSPVFGLAGYIMPHNHTRNFATWFYQLKCSLLQSEIRHCGKHPATWEKKGNDLFTSRNISKYPAVREAAFRLLNKIDRMEGKLFYYGREKYMRPEDGHPAGLYDTVLGHSIRSIDKFCQQRQRLFTMTLDQHSGRIKLLETAAKTMFGSQPAKCLIEPPFNVESHLYQTVQAADWIATLVGRLMAYRSCPIEYADWEWASKYFGPAVDKISTHSKFWRPSPANTRTPISS